MTGDEGDVQELFASGSSAVTVKYPPATADTAFFFVKYRFRNQVSVPDFKLPATAFLLKPGQCFPVLRISGQVS